MVYRRLKCAMILILFAMAVVLAYAGPKDFWVTKPYTEWNAKEVEKLLLKDSPWTRVLLLNAPGQVSSIGSTSKGGGGGGGGGGSSGALPPPIYVNWNARPIREAAVRQMTLQKPDTAKAQLDAVLNRQSQFIEFWVTGISAGGGRGGGEFDLEKFKAATCLQKKDQTKIPLAQVVMPRGRNQPMILQFPKEIDGKPAVTLEDKEIVLSIRVGEQTYKLDKFKLADMVIGDKLEI